MLVVNSARERGEGGEKVRSKDRDGGVPGG